ncbi:hypothetical protein LIER_37838 [Lithospermum erythrorhizon]|uniref:Uncharacterized protein n=1 Tax=Lithospermum erythrorhizon TaxID=34254 RepID=A0AAV3PRB0_LITER
MNNNNTLTMQMQCLSDIISHFKWPKVTALYEQTNSFSSMDLGIITQFSDSLKDSSNSIIDHHLASLLESMEPSLIKNMQGVIGFKTQVFQENNKSHAQRV